jgi:CubicO group peptidase (beta-lactamase class C family)
MAERRGRELDPDIPADTIEPNDDTHASQRPADMTLTSWDRAPHNRWAYQHLAEFLPTAPIAGGLGDPLLPAANTIDLDSFEFADRQGAISTARSLLDHTWTDGFVILRNGRIACEHYENAMRPESVHLTQSISKSVVGTVAGILTHVGEFPLERTVAFYVPEFAACAYRDVTMRQLLDMTSGVDFPEDVADPVSGFGRMDIAVGWKQVPADNPSPRSLRGLIRSLASIARPHGLSFEYRSMETEVLGFCIEAATGQSLSRLVSDLVWRPMGSEHDANFALDPEGVTIADGGLSASMRDLARFGLIYAQDGSCNGRQIVPDAWVRETGRGDPSVFPNHYRGGRDAYRNQFWIEDASKSTIMALGVYGQMIYVDPQRQLVGVKLSTWPEALNPALRLDVQALMHALALP